MNRIDVWRERIVDLATVGVLGSLPLGVWFIFFSGKGIGAVDRAMTGDEWRAKYEAPLLEEPVLEDGWVRSDL
jgi:hypothetical protein